MKQGRLLYVLNKILSNVRKADCQA